MRKTYIPDITGKERRLLKKIYKKCNRKFAYRAQIILLAVELCPQYTVALIATICCCTRQTVYNVFERFNENRIIGLFDDLRSGRPRKIDAATTDSLLTILEQKTPRDTGYYLHSKWTLKLVHDYLVRQWQIQAVPRTIARWLYQNDWTYSRSKNEFKAPGPLAEKEQRSVIKLLKNINSQQDVSCSSISPLFILRAYLPAVGVPRGNRNVFTIPAARANFGYLGPLTRIRRKFITAFATTVTA